MPRCRHRIHAHGYIKQTESIVCVCVCYLTYSMCDQIDKTSRQHTNKVRRKICRYYDRHSRTYKYSRIVDTLEKHAKLASRNAAELGGRTRNVFMNKTIHQKQNNRNSQQFQFKTKTRLHAKRRVCERARAIVVVTIGIIAARSNITNEMWWRKPQSDYIKLNAGERDTASAHHTLTANEQRVSA